MAHQPSKPRVSRSIRDERATRKRQATQALRAEWPQSEAEQTQALISALQDRLDELQEELAEARAELETWRAASGLSVPEISMIRVRPDAVHALCRRMGGVR